MIFNGTKFELLRNGYNENLKNATNYLWPQPINIFGEKETLGNLGVIMNNKATSSDLINRVCFHVSQRAGWILGTFQCRRISFMKQMWKSVVHAHVDYYSQLYQPLQPGSLQRLDTLQKTFYKHSKTQWLVSHVDVSHVMCCLSPVICHLTPVKCH